MSHTTSWNGHGWLRLVGATLVAGLIGWMTWVTVHVANYVSGEKRGERLSTIEARLMIEEADKALRREWDAKLEEFAKRLTR